jgi:peptide/nickel transport system permease protein
MLSRVIHGARPSLYTGVLVVSISAVLGLLVGVSSAYFGGNFDLLVQRLVDGLSAIPGLVFAMALLTVFSSGIHIWKLSLPLVWKTTPIAVVATLSVLSIPTTSRVVRSAALAIVANPYIEAAKSVGAGPIRILWHHLVPNVLAPLIVITSVQLGAVILIEASLSFLGLGIPPPYPSWGAMLQGNGRRFMEVAPWLAIFPGAAISLAVLGFNLFGDAMRDELDPRLRGTGGAKR